MFQAIVTCPWCGRDFGKEASERHIDWCKDRTNDHGEPMNPRGNNTARDCGSKNHTAKEVSFEKNDPLANCFSLFLVFKHIYKSTQKQFFLL